MEDSLMLNNEIILQHSPEYIITELTNNEGWGIIFIETENIIIQNVIVAIYDYKYDEKRKGYKKIINDDSILELNNVIKNIEDRLSN